MSQKKNGNGAGDKRKSDAFRIESIGIKGFKSIVSQVIHLGRLNVFIGANGAGKTALLEAVGVLGAAADGRVDDAELMRRGVRPGVPHLYKSAFKSGKIPRTIVLEAASSFKATYKAGLDNPKDSADSPWHFHSESITKEGANLITRAPAGATFWDVAGKGKPFRPKDGYCGLARSPSPFGPLPDSVERLLDALREYVIYDPQTAVLRGTQGDIMQRDPLGLQGGRLAEAVSLLREKKQKFGDLDMSELCQTVEWMEDVGSQRPTSDLISPSIPVVSEIVRFTDRFMREERNLLSAYDASEGVLFLLFAFALLFHPRSPRFFAIENIDHALHPRLARYVVRTMADHVKRAGKQILLTTHNPLVLDGLRLADDDIRLFAVDRDVDGYTVVKRIAYSEALAEAEKSGLTLSSMWTKGVLGAVPNLG
jgi:predicted ATPase